MILISGQEELADDISFGKVLFGFYIHLYPCAKASGSKSPLALDITFLDSIPKCIKY
jgi:hypothetical protein